MNKINKMQETNSDDEQYANDSFEQESDNVTIPEISETESEMDVRPSTSKQNKNHNSQQHQRYHSHRFDTKFVKKRHQQYKTSSDEDDYDNDDVVIGEVNTEINTVPMNMDTLETTEKFNVNLKSRKTTTTTPCLSRQRSKEKHLHKKNLTESDDEELQKIQLKCHKSKEQQITETNQISTKDRQLKKHKKKLYPSDNEGYVNDNANEVDNDDGDCDNNDKTMENLFQISNDQNYSQFLSNEEYMAMNAKFKSMLMTDEFKNMHEYNNFAQSTHREYHDSENDKFNYKNGFYFDDDIPSMVSDILISNNILQPTMDNEKLNDADDYEYYEDEDEDDDDDEDDTNVTLTDEILKNQNNINNAQQFLNTSNVHDRQCLSDNKSSKSKKNSARKYMNEDPKTKVEEFKNMKYYEYEMDQSNANECEIFEIDDNGDRFQIAEYDDNDENEDEEVDENGDEKFSNRQPKRVAAGEDDFKNFVEESYDFGDENKQQIYNDIKFKLNEAFNNAEIGEKSYDSAVESVPTSKPPLPANAVKNLKTSDIFGDQENKNSNAKSLVVGIKNSQKQQTKANEINMNANNNHKQTVKTAKLQPQETNNPVEEKYEKVDDKIAATLKAPIKQPLYKPVKHSKAEIDSLAIRATQLPSRIPIRAPVFKAANAKQLAKATAEATAATKSHILKGQRPMSRVNSPGTLSETNNVYKVNRRSPINKRSIQSNNSAVLKHDKGATIAGVTYRQENLCYEGLMHPYGQIESYENTTIYENEEDYEEEEEYEGEEEYEDERSPQNFEEQVGDEEDPSQFSRWDYQFCSQTPSELTEQAYQLQISVVQSKHRGKGAYRKSYSFTNARFREIERTNRILVQKILTHKELARKKTKKLKAKKVVPHRTTASVNRKEQQRLICRENAAMKRRLAAINIRTPTY